MGPTFVPHSISIRVYPLRTNPVTILIEVLFFFRLNVVDEGFVFFLSIWWWVG